MASKKDFRVKHGLRVSDNALFGTTTGGMSGVITIRDNTTGLPKLYIDSDLSNSTDYLIFARSDQGSTNNTKFYVRNDGSIYSEGSISTNGNLIVPASQSFVISGSDAGDQCTTIPFPANGTFESNSSTQTGALRIHLPVSWTNTMMSMEIDIYEYRTPGNITTLKIGGYNYLPTTTWFNYYGYTIASYSNDSYLITYGHDGSKCNIFITKNDSGVSTTWAYPHIRIKNVILGWGGFDNEWDNDWKISFTSTALSGSQNVRLYPQVTFQESSPNYIPIFKSTNTYNGTVSASVIYQDGVNIGVGTTNASFPLTINGKGYSDTELQGGNAIMKTETYSTSSVSMFGSNATTQPIIFAINSDPSRYDAHITANGTFGVGPKYATSTYKMHISGGSSTSHNALRVDGGQGTESTDFITIRGGNAGRSMGINDYQGDLKLTWWHDVENDTNPRYAIGYADNYDQLEIVRNSSRVGNSCLLSINSAGHIGTNTFFPQHSLEINSLSGDQGVRFNSAGHRSWIRVSDRSGSFYFSAYSKKLLIGSSNTVENSNAMFVLSTGFVGIKEPNPIHALTVNGNISASGTIFGATEATSVTSAELLNGYSDTQFVRSDINDYVDGKLFFNNIVGIGTDNPYEGFHFKGENILMTGDFIKGARAIGFDWTTNNTFSATWYNHGVYSSEDPFADIWDDNLSIASFHNIRVFLDSNNNNATSVFTIHDNSISGYDDSSVLFSVLGPSGKVGINTAPDFVTTELTVNGSISANNDINTQGDFLSQGTARFGTGSALNSPDVYVEFSDINPSRIINNQTYSNGGRALFYGDSSPTNCYLQTNTIGTLGLTVSGAAVFNNENTNADVVIKGVTDSSLIYCDASTDRVGIGKTNPSFKFDTTGDGRFTTNLYLGSNIIHDGDTNTWIGFHGADLWRVVTNNVERIEVSTSETVVNDGGASYDFRVEGDTDPHLLFCDGSADNVGVGTSNPTYKLEVNGTCHVVGNFTVGGTKSFLIDHPNPALTHSHYLQHVCLEGPEAAVYVRGTSSNSHIMIPDYWRFLVDESTITISLTPKYKFQPLYTESIDIENNIIHIGGFEPGDTYDYVVYGVRTDVEELQPVVNKELINITNPLK